MDASALSRRQCHLRSPRGFTLLEVLVVVTLIGIIGAAITLTIGSRSDDALVEEAEHLLGVVNYAGEAAVLGGRPYGLFITPHAYETVVFDGSHWLTAETGSVRPVRAVPAPYVLRGKSVFDLRRREAETPQMIFLPDGTQYFDAVAVVNETSGEQFALEAVGGGRFVLADVAASR